MRNTFQIVWQFINFVVNPFAEIFGQLKVTKKG